MRGVEPHLPAGASDAVDGTASRAGDEDVARRTWDRDVTVWAPEGTAEVADRLGWLDIASRTRAHLDELGEFVDGVVADGYTDVVLLGMGGSSLAPEVFRLVHPDADGLRLHVLDTTEPVQVKKVADAVDLDRTLFLYSSKSGGTIEPNSLFRHFWALQGDGAHYAAVTDPDTALGALAEEHSFRKVFVNDPDIGGRYSALSWFGIVPAALLGVDVAAALAVAVEAEGECGPDVAAGENPGLWLGAAVGALAREGRDKLTFVIDAPLESFGLWVEQLVAESTGKHGRGILPVADEPLVAPDRYGDDRIFVHLRDTDAPDPGHEAAVRALADAGHAVIVVDSHRDGLARLMFVAEFAIAVAGWALEINPFDQPNVQEAKDATNAVLESGPPELPDGELGEVLDGLAPPGYVAIMGYLPYEEATDAAVGRLREALIDRHGVATTWGYGPRFLHSTGQYHKGGPESGRFLQLVHDADADLEVPGKPFGLRQLIDAQADGDLQTLRSHGLPAVRVRLDAADLSGSIDALTARVREA